MHTYTGFVYTQTTDRLWRKNRQRVSGNSCVGRDNNRNWPHKWEVTGGASTNPCSETFKGEAAGDAPENKGLIAHANSLRDSRGIRLFIDFHSYGQYILWRRLTPHLLYPPILPLPSSFPPNVSEGWIEWLTC